MAALLIAWRVVAVGLGAWLAEDRPQLALRLDPAQPDALTRSAQDELIEDRTSPSALARRALAYRPLNAPAFRILAFDAAHHGQSARADALMAQAVAMTRRDPPASFWIYHKAMKAGDYGPAMARADELLRRGEYFDQLFPSMIAVADDPAAAQALAERLSLAPPWRPEFVAALGRRGSEVAVRAVLHRVQAGPRPLSDHEMSGALRGYLETHDRRQDRALWLELLPPAQHALAGDLFDGGFESRIGMAPFGWQEANAQGGSVEFAPRPNGEGQALHVQHYGDRTEAVLGQMLVLDPGVWRLSGRMMTESGENGELVWRVICGAGRRVLAQPSADGREGWRPMEAVFTVPAGCLTQWLSLQARPHGGGGAAAWFDDLRLEPAGGVR